MLQSRFARLARQPAAVAAAAAGLMAVLPAGATSLQEAVRRGVAAHPQVRAAAADAQRAEAEVDVARNGRWPSVQATTGPERGGMVYTITAAQTLYDWGRTERRIDAAAATARSQSEELAGEREAAALAIGETYLDVLTSQARIAAGRRRIERLEELEAMSQRRLAGGYGELGETGRVAAELARARDELAHDQGRHEEAIVQYRELVGEMPHGLHAPRLPRLFADRRSLAGLEQAFHEAPAVRQARAEMEASTARMRDAEAGRWPQLEVYGSMTRRKIAGEHVSDSSVGVQLRMEAVQGLSAFDRARAERQRAEAARWQLRHAERELRRKVLAMFETESALRARLPLVAERVRQLEQLTGVYAEQFGAGRRSFNELLTLHLERHEAERQQIELADQLQRLPLRLASELGLLLPWLEGRLDASAHHAEQARAQ